MNKTIQQKRSELLGLVQEEIAERRKTIERLKELLEEADDELSELTNFADDLIVD